MAAQLGRRMVGEITDRALQLRDHMGGFVLEDVPLHPVLLGRRQKMRPIDRAFAQGDEIILRRMAGHLAQGRARADVLEVQQLHPVGIAAQQSDRILAGLGHPENIDLQLDAGRVGLGQETVEQGAPRLVLAELEAVQVIEDMQAGPLQRRTGLVEGVGRDVDIVGGDALVRAGAGRLDPGDADMADAERLGLGDNAGHVALQLGKLDVVPDRLEVDAIEFDLELFRRAAEQAIDLDILDAEPGDLRQRTRQVGGQFLMQTVELESQFVGIGAAGGGNALFGTRAETQAGQEK